MKGNPGDPATKRTQRHIQLWHKIRDHRCWFRQQGRPAVDSEVVAEILMNIAYKDHYRYLTRGTRGRVRVFERRGQWVFSEREYADELGWGRGRLRRFLEDYAAGDPDEPACEPEITLERDQMGTRLTWLKKADWPTEPTASDTTNDTSITAETEPLSDHSRTTLYSVEGVEGVEGTTTPGRPVDKSVDNFLPQAARVYEAFAAAAGIVTKNGDRLIPNRPMFPGERVAIERALRTGVDFQVLAEFVRETTAEGMRLKPPIGSANYAIKAWWNAREKQASKPRDSQRQEPQDRPLKPAYHERAQPSPRHELTDEENENALGSIRGVLKKLCLPSTGGK